MRGGRALAQDGMGLLRDILDLHAGHDAIMALLAPKHNRPLASSLAGEQLSHRFFVGDGAGPACSGPLAVGCERGHDLGFFEKLGRGAACDCLEPTQLGQRDDRRRSPPR